MYEEVMTAILHIAYSRYRAIPAIDIDIRDISVGTLTSGLAASRTAPHACMQCNRSIYLAEDSKHSMNFWYRYKEGRFNFFKVLYCFISLSNSASLLNTVVTDQPMCAPYTYMHRTVQRMRKSLSQRIRVLRSNISISIADIDRYRLYAIARILHRCCSQKIIFYMKLKLI